MDTIKGLLGLIVLAGPLFPLLFYAFLVLIVAKLISKITAAYGKKHGGRYVVLLFIVFMLGDAPIVLGTLNYQCDNNAGFTLYKTLDEWKRENPGISETLIPTTGANSTEDGNITRYQLNQRFVWKINVSRWPFIGINKRVEHIIDTETGDILAEYIDFNGLSEKGIRDWNPLNPQDLKFWLKVKSCEKSDGRRTQPQKHIFNKFKTLIKHQYQKEYK